MSGTRHVNHSTIHGDGLAIKGDFNTVTGNDLCIHGDHNTVTGDNMIVKGDFNTISSAGVVVMGVHNTVRGGQLDIDGDFNTVSGSSVKIRGDYNTYSGDRTDVKGDFNTNTRRSEASSSSSSRPERPQRGRVSGTSIRNLTVSNEGVFIDGMRVADGGNHMSFGRVEIGGNATTHFGPMFGNTPITRHGTGAGRDRDEATKFPEAYPNEPTAEDGTCIICSERESNVVAVPCGHAVSCVTCCLILKTSGQKNGLKHICPSCRADVVQFVRTFN